MHVLYIPVPIPSSDDTSLCDYCVELTAITGQPWKEPVKAGEELAHFLFEKADSTFCASLFETLRECYDN